MKNPNTISRRHAVKDFALPGRRAARLTRALLFDGRAEPFVNDADGNRPPTRDGRGGHRASLARGAWKPPIHADGRCPSVPGQTKPD